MNDPTFYDQIYAANPDKWTSEIRNMIAFATLSKYVTSPATLLDIGCGNGHTLRYFKDRWPTTAIFGLDFSEEAIRIAKEKVPEGTFKCGSFEDRIIRSQVVTIMGVAEHFKILGASLIHLKKFGYLFYMECPNCLAYSPTKEMGFRKTDEGADQEEWHLNRPSWEATIKKAGFEILESLKGPSPEFEFIWVLR